MFGHQFFRVGFKHLSRCVDFFVCLISIFSAGRVLCCSFHIFTMPCRAVRRRVVFAVAARLRSFYKLCSMLLCKQKVPNVIIVAGLTQRYTQSRRVPDTRHTVEGREGRKRVLGRYICVLYIICFTVPAVGQRKTRSRLAGRTSRACDVTLGPNIGHTRFSKFIPVPPSVPKRSQGTRHGFITIGRLGGKLAISTFNLQEFE